MNLIRLKAAFYEWKLLIKNYETLQFYELAQYKARIIELDAEINFLEGMTGVTCADLD